MPLQKCFISLTLLPNDALILSAGFSMQDKISPSPNVKSAVVLYQISLLEVQKLKQLQRSDLSKMCLVKKLDNHAHVEDLVATLEDVNRGKGLSQVNENRS